MMPKPSQGRIVTARGGRAVSNGCETAPALITRVFGQNENGSWTVNATLFPDATDPRTVTSVYLYEDEDALPADLADNPRVTALHWPARV